MSFGVISIPGGGSNESPRRQVDGYAILLAGPTVTQNLAPGPGVEWDAFTVTNFSSDWIRFVANGPDITGNRAGLVAPGGGTVALSFGDGGNNPIIDLTLEALDVTGIAVGVTSVLTIPSAVAAAGDGLITVIMQEK